MSVESLGEKRYFVLFKDDYSKFRAVYFLNKKSDVENKFKIFCNEVKTRFDKDIVELRTDGGKEYAGKEIADFLNNRGIKHSITAPYTPEQNGSSERENRTIMEAARSMIYSNPDIPQFLWAEAVNMAVYVINRTGPTRVDGKTPYELWFDKKPKIDNLKVFGTECFVHIPKQKRSKLDKKAQRGYLVGYMEGVKGYRVWVPEINDVVLNHDVIFKPEKLSICVTEFENLQNDLKQNAIEDDDELNESATEENVPTPVVLPKLRDRNKIKRPDFFGVPVAMVAECEPMSFSGAVSSKNSQNWIKAMEKEIDSLHTNSTWNLVDKLENMKVIGNRWVYRIKYNLDGTIDRYKACLVVKGHSQ
jgi:hypothetical protein